MLAYSDKSRSVTMEGLFGYFGISREGFRKAKRSIEARVKLMAEISKEVVKYRQEEDRRAGSRSLFFNLGIKEHYGIGINKFERLVSMAGLSLAPMRSPEITTRSCTQSWNYLNSISGLTIWSINAVIVGDITYLSLGSKRYYLFCLTDIYSARIVGHCVHERMRKSEALAALRMCLKLRGRESIKGCIHHSDGGGQYFSNQYLSLLKKHSMQVSVARDCFENGYAEQRNGLIKHHLLPTLKTTDPDKIGDSIASLIERYNYKRKQEALGWRSPVEYEEWTKNSERKERKTVSDYLKSKQNLL